MAQSNFIQKLNHTHEGIMLWLLENPDKSLRECADHFNYSQSWLSTVIHSDAFQAQYKLLIGAAQTRVVADIPARMTRIADIALDKLTEMVAASEDPRFIAETSDKILHRLGYAPNADSKRNGAPPPPVQNNFFISSDDLANARAKFGSPAQTVEGEIITAEEVPIASMPAATE